MPIFVIVILSVIGYLILGFFISSIVQRTSWKDDEIKGPIVVFWPVLTFVALPLYGIYRLTKAIGEFPAWLLDKREETRELSRQRLRLMALYEEEKEEEQRQPRHIPHPQPKARMKASRKEETKTKPQFVKSDLQL